MEQPTKEFALHLRHIASLNGDWDKDIITVCDAYLALREEVKAYQKVYLDFEAIVPELQAENRRLRADNEALKQRLDKQ